MASAPRITPVAVQFGVHLTEPAPFYSAFTGRGGSAPVQFHVLLECDGDEPEARCNAALASLRRRLTNLGPASLTTTLHSAFQACHQELSGAPGGGVGATILASRGEESFLAAVADISLFQLDRAGVRPVRIAVPGTMSPVMGVAPEVTVAMERLDLEPGETVLVANSSVTSAANYAGLHAILSARPQTAANSLAAVMGNTPLFLALIVTSPEE